MRFSEMPTEKACDVMIELVPHVQAIVEDKALIDALSKKADLPQGATVAQKLSVVCGKLAALLPLMLQGRRHEIFSILAIMNGSTEDAVAAQPFGVTCEQVKELLIDAGARDFFSSFMPQGQKER